ncbi:family 43 glycosylhydrolase [Gaoshiqia sediminis]|uniref:Family 43 glycosylhydrolase n=1 Tax=Gaoshiqia sediminis TaxID=2986998 RepID=A0AA42CAZ9_9BACT|nr:family 43 glycosylhydrolase [Gaoshiqia sediminis]MCW0484532.1 family 43 glycosylhydrolase [Gaoshiqia sediminis]
MKVIIKPILVILFFQLTFHVKAQYQTQPCDKGDGYYLNPVFAGDYPDPSIMRDGDTYYMVHSSFEYYPGLTVWESKDLINWNPVTSALHKYIGSVWAPDIAKYKDKYYIYFPANDKIYVVVADSINGQWSDPIDLNIKAIDPGHVVDENGKRYLYFNSGGYVQLSDDGLSVVGEITHSYDGWPIPRDWSIELFALEGPKLTKHGDYYYLTVAEGGTAGPATGHMIISARSKSPFGPWENSPYNPIVKTWSKAERWWSKGHGTILEDTKGSWWVVFHGYEKDYLNMGRQTLMEPIEWTEDGWFKITDGVKTEEPIKRPYAETAKSTFSLSDDFDGKSLGLQWKFFGEYDTTRFHFADNSLVVKGKGNYVSNCSPMLCVPSDHSYTAEVELVIDGNAVGGLVMFYNNSAYSGILADTENVLTNLRGWQFASEKNVIEKHVFLKLKNTENTVDMFYSTDGENWTKIETSLEVSSLNHNGLSGFLSLRIGLCAIGEGSVQFKNFKYQPIK